MRFFIACLLASVLALLGPTRTAAQSSTAVQEDVLKAVLFFKLPLYVQRKPATDPSDETVVLCVLGATPISDALRQLVKAPADPRPAELRLLRSAASASGCGLIFIGRSESAQLSSVLETLSSLPAVTVSDLPGFAEAGGMVEFQLREDGSGLAIAINRNAAQARQIDFSAQLLRLARIVGP